MRRLLWGAIRELAGRWGLPAALVWILLAAGAAADATLGTGSLGEYLALVCAIPVALLFRIAWLAERRRLEGWDLEERLRDPGGWRLPVAELGAVVLLAAALLGLAWLPTLAPGLRPAPDQGHSFRSVRVDSRPDEWRIRLPSPCPGDGRLEILLEWQEPPARELALVSSLGRSEPIEAGSMTTWTLDRAEAAAGELVLVRLPGARLNQEWLRLVLPRPGLEAAPWLLLGQLLFFAPLFALALLLARSRVRAGLAALGSLGFGGLAAWLPPEDPELGSSPVGWVAGALVEAADWLPPVEGLLATGPDFELRYGQAPLWGTALWLLLGAAALVLARRRILR
ncbi:MAG: hypothetical protein ISR76_04620 [Planctomycetes bacterium]|nr:hypothetical protein [Planctomycetota bacterium]